MKIFVGQIYIEAGINYPFTHVFQAWISDELTKLVLPSKAFSQAYPDFDLTLRMSAKAKLLTPEIKGPTVFHRSKDIEFTIFLPFLACQLTDLTSYRQPLDLFIDTLSTVLRNIDIDVSQLNENKGRLVEHVITTPEMFNRNSWN